MGVKREGNETFKYELRHFNGKSANRNRIAARSCFELDRLA